MKIIDVSHHNGNIDWQTVKGNVDGVILHCGYGQDLEKQDDPRFREWATECTILGIPFGVYLYSYAKSVDRIEGEAKHTLRLIKGYNLSLPVFFDSEEPGTESVAQHVHLSIWRSSRQQAIQSASMRVSLGTSPICQASKTAHCGSLSMASTTDSHTSSQASTECGAGSTPAPEQYRASRQAVSISQNATLMLHPLLRM